MKSFILWLLGPTSSGKTTLAEHFVDAWRDQGLQIIHYDGDEVRNFFGPNHGFEDHERLQVVKTLSHLANKAHASGFNVIVSALTASNEARKFVANELENLVVGYVNCPIEICSKRDPKGLYAKAKSGEIETLVGWNSPYLEPENPDITLRTHTTTPDMLFLEIDQYLKNRT